MPIALHEEPVTNSFAWPPPPPGGFFDQQALASDTAPAPVPTLSASDAVAAAAAAHPGYSQARTLPSVLEAVRADVASLLGPMGLPMPLGQITQSVTARTRSVLEDAQLDLKTALQGAPEFIVTNMAGSEMVRFGPRVDQRVLARSHQSDDERTAFPHVDSQSQSGSASSYHAARETPPRERPEMRQTPPNRKEKKERYRQPYTAPLAPGARRVGQRSASEAVAAAAAAHPGWSQVQGSEVQSEPRARAPVFQAPVFTDMVERTPMHAPAAKDEVMALWKARCRARALPHHNPPTDLAAVHASLMRPGGWNSSESPEKPAEKNKKTRQQLRQQKRKQNQDRKQATARPSTFEYKSPSPPRPFQLADDPSIVSFSSAPAMPDDPCIVSYSGPSLDNLPVSLGFLDDECKPSFDSTFARRSGA